jgi:transglutaminase-like putative cysteine protease
MRIAIEHVTRYRYSDEASYSVQSLRLTPSEYDGQTVLEWRIEGQPDGQLTRTRDGFGNALHLMTVEVPHREVAITARGVVAVEDRSGLVRGLAESVPLRVWLRHTALTSGAPAITGLAEGVPASERLAWLHALMAAIRERVDYVVGATHSATPAAAALAAGQGVCQDHAHIFIAACRASGVPARYVTGYLLMAGSDPEPAHHAWAEAWVEGLGWVGFDVANRVCPTDRYVRMAAALDAHYAAPIRGSRRGGGEEVLEVEVVVQQQSAQQ